MNDPFSIKSFFIFTLNVQNWSFRSSRFILPFEIAGLFESVLRPILHLFVFLIIKVACHEDKI